jgi:plastocyanin
MHSGTAAAAAQRHSAPRTGARAIGGASVLVLALLAMLVAGCGGSSGSTSSSTAKSASPTTPSTSSASSSSTSETAGPGNALTLEANKEGELKYDKKSLSASAGKVSIAFTNMSPLEHNMTIESSSGKVLAATPTFRGGAKTLTLNLKPGTYKFFCSVPGHRMAGMEGTLTVH